MLERKNPVVDDSLVGESTTGFDDVSLLPSRLERYSTARNRTVLMSGYIKKAIRGKYFDGLSVNLKNCGSYLCFHDYYTVGKIRLARASFCNNHFLCPLCAIRRGAKALKAYLERFEVILSDNSDVKPYLVTLTVKNGDGLRERFQHLKDSISDMQVQKRVHERGKGPMYEINKALGGVGSIEFKRGKNSQKWHPHYHAIWLCREAPDSVLLSEEWKMITRDSYIVDVTPIEGPDYVGGFCEVFKYAVKFSDLPLKDNFEAYLALTGRRMINSFGLFRGVVVPPELNDDLIEDLPYIERLYNHSKSGYAIAGVPKHYGLGDPAGAPVPSNYWLHPKVKGAKESKIPSDYEEKWRLFRSEFVGPMPY